MIGREIVQEEQKGISRAAYGEQIIDELSLSLSKEYGRGFSTTNLRYFRTFYLTYLDRNPVIYNAKLSQSQIRHMPCGELSFHPNLGWSHYRTLMKIENKQARLFYEIETAKNSWSVSSLEKQIYSFLFERLLKSRDKKGVLQLANKGQIIKKPIDLVKDPYVLDFLDFPDSSNLHESDIESAIIGNLQKFILELGKGFSFVSRQKQIRFGDKIFYIDLVFYNYILKCFVLIDLKIGELTHQDIGQMDGYVRMFEEHEKLKGDNPTVGLILCSEKNEVIAKYSVLKESKQLFASKYMLYLPTEKELQKEIQRERKLIESRMK